MSGLLLVRFPETNYVWWSHISHAEQKITSSAARLTVHGSNVAFTCQQQTTVLAVESESNRFWSPEVVRCTNRRTDEPTPCVLSCHRIWSRVVRRWWHFSFIAALPKLALDFTPRIETSERERLFAEDPHPHCRIGVRTVLASLWKCFVRPETTIPRQGLAKIPNLVFGVSRKWTCTKPELVKAGWICLSPRGFLPVSEWYHRWRDPRYYLPPFSTLGFSCHTVPHYTGGSLPGMQERGFCFLILS